MDQCSTDGCDVDPAENPGRWLQAMIARAGGPREQDWADGRNRCGRPNPNLPWVYRGLPVRSCTCLDMCGVGRGPCVDVGHQHTVHDFPTTPAPETGARRTSVQRPERIA